MIEGQLIRLRVWQESDLATLVELRNDVTLQAQMLARARGSRPEHVREWLQSRTGGGDRLLFVIADSGDNGALGFVQISDLDPQDGHADLGICLAAGARGRGRGGETIELVATYLRDIWGLRKLCLKVRADNVAALRSYDKAGFQRCGLLRQHVHIEGHWQDVVLMERFLVPTAD